MRTLQSVQIIDAPSSEVWDVLVLAVRPRTGGASSR